jgi:4-diphosphocytidyl-2-C-methyl-D-erythritol kinase
LPPILPESAPAKVNLTLHVTGRRADGYHLLETVIVFAGIGDVVRVRAHDRLALEIVGPQAAALAAAPEDRNLVMRAARALAAAARVRDGAAIALDKRLPVAAGLGGGSADAAAALRALARLWRLEGCAATLRGVAARLGADVPACLACRPLCARGIGERIAPLDGPWPEVHLVLANPGRPLATASVFAARAGTFGAPDPLERVPGTAQALAAALARRRNDLEAPARRLMPEIGEILDLVAALPGCLLARMPGSGATCFGMFADGPAAEAGAAALRRARPGWWVAAAPMLDRPPDAGAVSARARPRSAG